MYNIFFVHFPQIFSDYIQEKYFSEIFRSNIHQKYSAQTVINIFDIIVTKYLFAIFTNVLKYSVAIFHVHYSFKNLLRAITHDNTSTVRFLQEQKVLQSTVYCPGPLVQGHRIGGCGHLMTLKQTNDSKDLFMWRCRHVHTVQHKKHDLQGEGHKAKHKT